MWTHFCFNISPGYVLKPVMKTVSVPAAPAPTSGGSGVGTPPLTAPPVGGTPPLTTTPANTGQNVALINPLGTGSCSNNGDCLSSFLTSILQFVVRIGAIVVVFMLVYVGFLFVTARGNEIKITAARTALLWTVVGALILLGAQAIAMAIQATVKALSPGG